MALGRLLLIVTIVGIMGWVYVRAVTVNSANQQLNISIDTQKLKQASREAVQQGRQAVSTAGQYLSRTGKAMEQVGAEEASPVPAPPQPPARPWFTLPWSRPQKSAPAP